MTLDAFFASLVPPDFDTHQFATCTVGIFEPGVTPEAKFPGRVKRQILFVIGMIDRRSMTVFAFDRFMGRRIELQYVFFMTFNTGFSSPVLNGKIFPFLNVAQTVIAVGKVPAVNTEVIGNQKLSGYEYQTDQTDCNPQWAQDMPLHRHLPRCAERTEKVYELTAAVAM
jgi:hypothetical protein